MQLSDWLRVLVAGGAVVAALGSATSQPQPQPTGYYPRPTAAQAPAQPGAEPAAAVPGSCEALCDQVVRCDLAPYSDCVEQCRQSGTEQQPGGPAQLGVLAQASCAELAQLAQASSAGSADPGPAPANEPPQPPPPAKPDEHASTATPDKHASKSDEQTRGTRSKAKPDEQTPDAGSKNRTQWTCNATGSWQKCEMQGYSCYPQMTSSIGFGTTEALARLSAQTLCSSAMTSLMSANFTYRTSVTVPCRAISCSAPTAR